MFSNIDLICVDNGYTYPHVSVTLTIDITSILSAIEHEINITEYKETIQRVTALCNDIKKSFKQSQTIIDHCTDFYKIVSRDLESIKDNIMFEILSKCVMLLDNEEIKETNIKSFIIAIAAYLNIDVIDLDDNNQFKTLLKVVLTLIDNSIEFKNVESSVLDRINLRLKHTEKSKYIKVHSDYFIYSENSSKGYYTATLPYNKISLIPELGR